MSATTTDGAPKPQDPVPEPQREVPTKRPLGIWLCIVFIPVVLLFRLSMALFSQRMNIDPPGIPQHRIETLRRIGWIVFAARSLALVAAAASLARLRRLAIPFLDVEVVLGVLATVSAARAGQRVRAEYPGYFYWVWAGALPWLLILRYTLRLRKQGILTDQGTQGSEVSGAQAADAPATGDTSGAQAGPGQTTWTGHDRMLRVATFLVVFCLWTYSLPLLDAVLPGLEKGCGRFHFIVFLVGGIWAWRKPQGAFDARQEIKLDPIRKTPWF